jgi:hypothetical protein
MQQIAPPGFTELSIGEARAIEGGSPLGIATFLVTCFTAGFRFGYDTIGPALFD